MKKYLLLILLIAVCAMPVLSAENDNPSFANGIIKATIYDGKNNVPMEYANATVYIMKDSSYVTGSASGKDGELLIPNIPEGDYYVKVSFIGYEDTIIPNINVSAGKPEVTLGVVKIFPSEIKMDQVNVTGEKLTEEYHIDKRVINVSRDNNAAGGTALDVLQNQPSIQVDQDGNVLLRGSSNFTVLVNGRPGVLQNSDALRQIPANIIDNIELITNPSAKYDAEGAAGIINIITKTSELDNMSGILNGGVGSKTKYNSDATFNYKSGNWGLTANGDYRVFNMTNAQQFDRYTTTMTDNLFQRADINQNFRRESYSGKIGLDYTISPETGISISSTYGKFGFDGNFVLDGTNQTNSDEELTNYTSNRQVTDVTAKYFQSVLFLNHQFQPKVDELTFEAVYTNVDQPYYQIAREYITDAVHQSLSLDPKTVEFDNQTDRNDGRFKLNYSLNINDKSKLETGLQVNLAYRKFDYRINNFDWESNQWFADDVYTNNFDFKNNVYSVFATYSNTLDLLELDYQLGLRAENTDRLLHQITMNTDYTYNKVHLFPSVNMLKRLSDTQQLQFSYSRRINRPFEGALNPFPNYSDSYALVIGNPNLKPELINSFELNYQNTIETIFFSIQTYYRNTENTFQQTALIGDDGRIILSFGNIAKTNTFGSEISTSIPLAQWFKLDPSVNLYQTNLKGDLGTESYERNSFAWFSSLRTTLYFSAATRFQLNLFYTGKQATLQGDIDPIVNFSASIRQELFDRQLIVTATANNLFNTGKIKLYSNAGSSTDMYVDVRPEAPVFNLTFSFNFNNFRNTSKVNDRVDINVNSGI
ncbi:MAG: TonB-dependent receptor family protein [bacterium]